MIPKRANGCYSCRRMKVKCDEGKPDCSRCKKGRRKCLGYPDLWKVKFRSMNDAVAKAYSGPHALEGQTAPYILLQRPQIDWRDQALCFFLARYVLPPWEGDHGFLDFLPEMYRAYPKCEYFQSALEAASLASFGNLSCIQSISVNAISAYGRALRGVAQALDGRQNIANHCEALLVTLILLQLCELITGTARIDSPHVEGVEVLLKIARPQLVSSSLGRRVLHAINLQVAISGHERPSSQPPTALNSPRPESRTPPIKLQFLLLLFQASEAQRSLRACAQSNAGTQDHRLKLDDAINKALGANKAMAEWASSVPKGLKIKLLSQPGYTGHKDPTQFPKQIYAFINLQHVAIWTSFWAVRCHLLQEISEALQPYNSPTSDPSQLQLLNHVRAELSATLDDICNSIPYMFGEIDGSGNLLAQSTEKFLGSYFALVLLRRALAVGHIPLTQRAWMLDRLEEIGLTGGIRQALSLKRSILARDENQFGKGV